MFNRLIGYLLRIPCALKLRIEKKSQIKNFIFTPYQVATKMIGSNVYLGKGVKYVGAINQGYIGDYTYINDALIYDGVKIGKFCSIAHNVCIGPGEHYTNRIATYPVKIRVLNEPWEGVFPNTKETVIGNDVWVGNNATILSGVKIGNGAIIAAGAVVTHDVPPYTIVGGIPSRVIRYRFEQSTIEMLQKLEWWNKNYEWLKEHEELFDLDGTALHSYLEGLFK